MQEKWENVANNGPFFTVALKYNISIIKGTTIVSIAPQKNSSKFYYINVSLQKAPI